MGMKKLTALVVALVLCLCTASALAATLKVPTTEYPTVQDAFKDVVNGDVIQLVEDIEGPGIDFRKIADYTFDLNNHTYTVTGNLVGSKGSKTQAFRFYIPDASVTVKNGTLTATAASGALWLVNSYSSNVTYQNVTLDASQLTSSQTQALHINNGENQLLGTSSVIAPEGYPAIVVNDSTSSSYPGAATLNIDTTGKIQGDVNVTGGEQAELTVAKVGEDSQMDVTVEAGTAEMKNVPVGTKVTAAEGAKSVTVNDIDVTTKDVVIPELLDGSKKAYKNDLVFNGSGTLTVHSSDHLKNASVIQIASEDVVKGNGGDPELVMVNVSDKFGEGAPVWEMMFGNAGDVKVSEGSIKVEMSEGFLKSLKPGKYYVGISSAGGYVEGSFKVAAPSVANLPQTGDNSSLMLWVSLLVMTMVGFVLVGKKTRLN